MSERALLLSADPWDMTDEKSGERLKGVSAWYVSSYRDPTEAGLGYKPTKIPMSAEVYASLEKIQLPAMFDFDYASRPGAGNKATLTLVGAKHLQSINFFKSVA